MKMGVKSMIEAWNQGTPVLQGLQMVQVSVWRERSLWPSVWHALLKNILN